MADPLEAVLEVCWEDGKSTDAGASEQICRWCHYDSPGEHAPDCPCAALSLALQQRDALAAYAKAEKRYVFMQGAVRLAKKPDKAEMRRRLDEAVLTLEAALSRLNELGIEDMVR